MVKNKTDIRQGEPTVGGRDWQRFAYECARDARENHFCHRRGVWYIEDLDVVVYFENENAAMRESEINRLRTLLQAEGNKELGCATYSSAREGADSTFAIVLKPTWGQMTLVEYLIRRFDLQQAQRRQA